MINRPYLSSIAFRLPFAIAFICVSVIILSGVAIFGLKKARTEMADYSLQAFASLARASLVSRQVSDLVSSAPFLMNATSPYRVSSESRAVVTQVDGLLAAIREGKGAKLTEGFSSSHIIELLEGVRGQTLNLARDADAAQAFKAEAAAALGEIATRSEIIDVALRGRLNAIVQSASNSDSLFQLGELKRRYVGETASLMLGGAPGQTALPPELAPYERVFQSQTSYLVAMFAIRGAVTRLHSVSRDLSHATETQSYAVAQGLNEGPVSYTHLTLPTN